MRTEILKEVAKIINDDEYICQVFDNPSWLDNNETVYTKDGVRVNVSDHYYADILGLTDEEWKALEPMIHMYRNDEEPKMELPKYKQDITPTDYKSRVTLENTRGKVWNILKKYAEDEESEKGNTGFINTLYFDRKHKRIKQIAAVAEWYFNGELYPADDTLSGSVYYTIQFHIPY